MKNIGWVLILAASTAWGEPDKIENKVLLACQVPSKETKKEDTVRVDVLMANDTSIDFVTFQVKEKSGQKILFIQATKGSVEKKLSSGALSTLVMEETAGQEAGVYKNSGLFNLQVAQDQSYQGMLIAFGNIYPLVCEKSQ